MLNINRSFMFGIAVASITWIVSLFLYVNLSYDLPKQNLIAIPSSSKSYISKKNSLDDVWKDSHESFQKSPQIKRNSDKLVKSLQPTFKKDDTGDFSDEIGLIKTVEDERKKQEGDKMYAYNILISEKLSYDRAVPDTRNALCKNLTYSSNLPSASIVICFYNEDIHTLLRTIHSLINRSPDNLLKEIILVDDFSDIENLHEDVQLYILKNFKDKVKLYKTERREGLIRARIFGARKAQGDVLVFLDSHVEANVGWIEPLLQRIQENSSNVVMPVIDIIHYDTFDYSASPLVRGGFTWSLLFKWVDLPKGTLSKKEDFIKPFISPTMAGGLFAINKNFFTHLGEYDAGMNIWGGENLEISFRIWMCGGRLEVIPCSRVGHIFRQRRPYGSPDGQNTVIYNSLRLAHVWMDSYKKYYLSLVPEARNIDYGDISSRLQLRKDLKCHDFDWYLKNVFPEQILPDDDAERLKNKWSAVEKNKFQPWHQRKRNYTDHYRIQLSNTSLCIAAAKDIKTKGYGLVLQNCSKIDEQAWYETDRNELVLGRLLCLQAGKLYPILYKCHEMGGDQEWRHKGENKSAIYNIAAGTCLGVKRAKVGATVSMKLCYENNLIIWNFVR